MAVDLKLPSSAQSQLHGLAKAGASIGLGEITGAWLIVYHMEIGGDGQNGDFSFNILATLADGPHGG